MPGYVKSAQALQTRQARMTQRLNLCIDKTKLWSKEEGNQTNHPASVRQILYLGRAINITLLISISILIYQQANSTERILQQTKQLLYYLALQEEAVLTYSAREIIVAVYSNAGYLNKTKARSRAEGHFFLSTNDDVPRNNGAILNIAYIIKHVISPATKAELAVFYIIAR